MSATSSHDTRIVTNAMTPTIVLRCLLPLDETAGALRIVRSAVPEADVICVVHAPGPAEQLRRAGENIIIPAGALASVRQVRSLKPDLFLALVPVGYAGTLTAARAIGLLIFCGAPWRGLVLAGEGWEIQVRAAMEALSRALRAGRLLRLGLRMKVNLATLKVLGRLLLSNAFGLVCACLCGLLALSAIAADRSAGLFRRNQSFEDH